MKRLAQDVSNACATDPASFHESVREEAQRLKAQIAIGTFDNPQPIVGLEYEFYGVASASGVLRRVPQPLLELIRFEKELGKHNAEYPGSPQPLDPHGLMAIQHAVQSAVQSARAATDRAENIRLVSDGSWTIPPAGESAVEYLGASVEIDDVVLSPNISESVRYHQFSNSATYEPGRFIDAPHVTLETETVMPATLTTSIQPHYQVPNATALPRHFRYALRLAGPLVAIAVNSPLFPPSLYDRDATVEDIVEDAWKEHRVTVFESVLNDPSREPKVRFPRDIERTEEAVDRMIDDTPVAPVRVDGGTKFDAQFAHLRHKHGAYWRWARPVFEGPTKSDANARIEFRPLPGQPTIRDSVAFIALFAGALYALDENDHPVRHLSWERARENFYNAVRDGLEADIHWITAEGRETSNLDELYTDVFDQARQGLEARGFDAERATAYLGPLRQRVDSRTTPASWKLDRLTFHGERGLPLSRAVIAAKRDYLHQQAETLIEGSFTDWEAV